MSTRARNEERQQAEEEAHFKKLEEHLTSRVPVEDVEEEKAAPAQGSLAPSARGHPPTPRRPPRFSRAGARAPERRDPREASDIHGETSPGQSSERPNSRSTRRSEGTAVSAHGRSRA